MRTAKNAYIAAIGIALAVVAAPVFADIEEVDCRAPENVNLMNAEKKSYKDMLAHDKAGRAKQAYEIASHLDSYCASNNDQDMERIDAEKIAVLKRSSLKLGQQAESKGEFAEAYKYYEDFHGIDADRAQMKLATAKPGDFETVRRGVYYLRDKQQFLNEAITRNTKTDDIDKARLAAINHSTSRDEVDALDPNRDARVKAIAGYLGKLKLIAKKQGEKYLADEDDVFKARKTSMMAKSDSFAELNKARDWYGLFGQEKLANDRAVKRGDTLFADDTRNSLELAISYYRFAGNEGKERKVQDKARRLGDDYLKQGKKKIAADYYNLAGLGDKASKLEEAHEAEKEKAETKRQEQFKKDQKSLEDELGF